MSESSFPEPINIYATRQPALWATAITTYGLAVIAVVLRFWSRKLVKASYYMDDWCAAAAVFVATGLLASGIVAIKQGLGLHVERLGPNYYIEYLKSLYVDEILYTFIICLAKFSILGFYLRIFGVTSMRWAVYILGGIISAWTIAVAIVTVFQCHPIRAFWNQVNPVPPAPYTCISFYAFYLGTAFPNIITDIVLLLLPLPYIWKLNQRTSTKRTLTAVFSIGGFVCVISIVRVLSLRTASDDDPDVSWKFAPVSIWTYTECNMAIVSSCLPSLKPILNYIVAGFVVPGETPRNYPTLRLTGKSSRVASRRTGNSHRDAQSSDCNLERVFMPLSDDADNPYRQSMEAPVAVLMDERSENALDLEMQSLKGSSPREIVELE